MMAIYFEHKVQSATQGAFCHLVWHSMHPLLAVAKYRDVTGGSVFISSDEGTNISNTLLQKPAGVQCLAWHPKRKILATGWENGDIDIKNVSENESYEVPRSHSVDVTILEWTSNGSRLLSGDVDGNLFLWKCDSRGRCQQAPISRHNYSEGFTRVVLRNLPTIDTSQDVATLARLAVSGDQMALNMFGVSGPGILNLSVSVMGPDEALSFFISGKNGGVYYLDEVGSCSYLFGVGTCVQNMLYSEEHSLLVTITSSLILTEHSISPDGEAKQILQVKMSSPSTDICTVWAGPTVLASAAGEGLVRMWDIEREENYILNPNKVANYDASDPINSVHFCSSKNLLAAGTSSGLIYLWKLLPKSTSSEPEDQWRLQTPTKLDGTITDILWGSNRSHLAVNCVNDVFILHEQSMSFSYAHQMAVSQTGQMSLTVDMFLTAKTQDLSTDVQIKGCCNTKDSIVVWNGKQIVVYEFSADTGMLRSAGTFGCESLQVGIHEQNLYTIDNGKVQVRNFQGIVKQILSRPEQEGTIEYIRVCSQYLVIACSNNFICLYDLSRREAKLHNSPKNLNESLPVRGFIHSVCCNSNGSYFSILIRKKKGSFYEKIFVVSSEAEVVHYFNFESGFNDHDDLPAQAAKLQDNPSDSEQLRGAGEVAGRVPISHFWDPNDPRLLVCETEIVPKARRDQFDDVRTSFASLGSTFTISDPESQGSLPLNPATLPLHPERTVACLLVCTERGVLLQDSYHVDERHEALAAVHVPFHYFTLKAEQVVAALPAEPPGPRRRMKSMERVTMRDFVGLEDAEQGPLEAMTDFGYFLTIGNMDEAFKAVKLIKSGSVWENMARMCVKTRRLDVAAVCLGSTGNALAARALRLSRELPELEARVAVLAVHLGMKEDAERLLKSCGRLDELSRFYQAAGEWQKALNLANRQDRIHLRSTHYNYARCLEAEGDIDGAIANYEASDTHRFEVPRMLGDDPQRLETYFQRSDDKVMKKWWAQYLECAGEMETALQIYDQNNDYLSMVRVHCLCGNLEKAAEICSNTGDRAASFHLAGVYEREGQIDEALDSFIRAQTFGNAIRICKANGREDKMLQLGLMGRPEEMIDAARYYESKPGYQDKAVILYHKAGHLSKALELAFSSKQFGALQTISQDLDDRADPQLLQRSADFFIENGQFDRAVDMLAIAKKPVEALRLCSQHHVPIDEQLVEKLTPAKGTLADSERQRMLEGIAEICMQQGEYQLAAKKYTQSGNKLKAMKALLKSGETQKIVYFANVSRQKDIYVLAANYLQTLDWSQSADIMKNIIAFYTKGRAPDRLAAFYGSCAQLEMDEYQNYEKAAGALREALKHLNKANVPNASEQEQRASEIEQRLSDIERFVKAENTYQKNSEEGISLMKAILKTGERKGGVRHGDVYARMIEHHARKENWKQAHSLIEEMRKKLPKQKLTFYVDAKLVQKIHSALGVDYSDTPEISKLQSEADGDDFVEEDVNED